MKKIYIVYELFPYSDDWNILYAFESLENAKEYISMVENKINEYLLFYRDYIDNHKNVINFIQDMLWFKYGIRYSYYEPQSFHIREIELKL